MEDQERWKLIEDNSESLKWPDYVVIAIVLSISASIGIYYRFSGGRQKTPEEYFSANHSMRISVVAITMTVTYLSGISMLGLSGEVYIYGSQFVAGIFGYLLATPIAAFFYLPVFFKLQSMSVYEYLEKRFGKTARLIASISNLIQMVLYSGVVLFAPALALEATTGLSSTMSVFLIGIICTFYSTIGGIKAVLATDVFQGFLMLASILCTIAIGCYDLEAGPMQVWEVAQRGGRLDVFNFDIDPTVRHTWWTLVIGTTFYFVAQVGVNQIQVQRLLSAKSLRSAQVALFINGPSIGIIIVITALSGFDREPLIDQRSIDESDYFYLYRISYQLYTPIGCLTTIIFGYLASILVAQFSKSREVDPDLLTPCLAARIRRQRAKKIETPSQASTVANTDKCVTRHQ